MQVKNSIDLPVAGYVSTMRLPNTFKLAYCQEF